MDAAIIEAIDSAQAAINAACLRNGKLSIGERTQIEVTDYQTLEDIATMLYGDDGWKAIAVDNFGGLTFCDLETPDGVKYRYVETAQDATMAALDELAVS